MGRAHAILQSEFSYNVTARCGNRDWFELPLEDIWTILSEELYMAHILHGLLIHSLVLMGNHFHLIVSTPSANISEAMKRFMEMTSRRIGARSARVNRIWGARHYKTVLQDPSYFLNAYKYNYFNPVKAGIVDRCEDYRFSTLSGLLGQTRLDFPLVEDNLLMSDPVGTLAWLNQRPSERELLAVQASFAKARFEHVKCPITRKPILEKGQVI